MWLFYQDTGARKWGHPYLTREAFDLIGEHMAERIILLIAYDAEERPVAGALHFLGADTLYGRYWGCLAEIPYLHFELCYYRAIDIARSEEHTSELQSLMRNSYAVFCLKKKNTKTQ